MNSIIASNGDPQAFDYDKRTPLHLAAAMGHLHIARCLTQHHDVDIDAMDIHNNTPLGDAIRHNQLATMQFLIEVGEVDCKCKFRAVIAIDDHHHNAINTTTRPRPTLSCAKTPTSTRAAASSMLRPPTTPPR